ncbi:hypothetical protein ACVWXO_004510 [Bradyrhizobium sp. LM2.7]
MIDHLARLAPLERLGQPEDVAATASFSRRIGRRMDQRPGAARQWRDHLIPPHNPDMVAIVQKPDALPLSAPGGKIEYQSVIPMPPVVTCGVLIFYSGKLPQRNWG